MRDFGHADVLAMLQVPVYKSNAVPCECLPFFCHHQAVAGSLPADDPRVAVCAPPPINGNAGPHQLGGQSFQPVRMILPYLDDESGIGQPGFEVRPVHSPFQVFNTVGRF